jgi:eukaryotic-like serine/threonine-protein kinase
MERIDNYKIVEKIGEGGMGDVYKGIDTMLEREVAIKMLRPELSRREDIVERFRSEAIALGRLNHSHIATVYNFGRVDDQYYMAMEFVSGETLDSIIQQHGRLPWRDAVQYAIQALEGLAHAHQSNVIHRDIKPANIIVNGKKTLKLLDFGIARILQTARLTRTKHSIGTPGYMSPEQHQSKEVDARSDIYAAGVVLYEMLTGQMPFQHDTEYGLVTAVIEDKPKRLRSIDKSIPAPLEKLVLKALQKKPEKRFADAQEFIVALRDCLAITETQPKPTREFSAHSSSRFIKLCQDYPVVILISMLFIVGGSYIVWQNKIASPFKNTLLTADTLAESSNINTVKPVAPIASDIEKTSIPLADISIPVPLLNTKLTEDKLLALKKAAENSDVKVQLYLAEMYSLGKGVDKDDKQAFKWYQTAAHQENMAGQYHIGLMLSQGIGTTKDTENAINWLSKAARQNHSESQILLGNMYLQGDSAPQNRDETKPWIESAAKQGGAEMQYKLGHLFLQDKVVSKDLTRARYWFEQAANKGLDKAQYNAGWMAQEGLGGDKATNKALEWYRKAAKQGYAKAEYRLAVMLYHPKATVKTNTEALAWLQKSADQDFLLALRWLAKIYKVGIPGMVSKDERKAHELEQKANIAEAEKTISP